MKKLKYIMVIAICFAVAFGCTDNSLDPLQFANIKKGTELALRGKQLQNVYVNGIPGATLVPQAGFTGSEVFTYDTELLAADPSSLSSVDIYVIKKTGATTSRVLVQNVPSSQFKTDGTYRGPWATITIKLTDVLAALGLPAFNDPSYKLDAPANQLLGTYKNGVLFESDINLTSGNKVLAADIVAAGLFQSNQFYPAMKMTWTVLKYCSYVPNWAGKWIGTEVGACCSGDDANTMVQDLVDPNKFIMDNFWGDGVTAYVIFTPSTNLTDQIVTFPDQTTDDPGTIIKSVGTYDQCKQTFSIKTSYKYGATTYTWVYNFVRG